ncbi:MAG: ABC transporter ATP-binding protein [Proteobacteria bacterium]|nr:ABC transporter ATP-binding protein [Pseudomonadota bacterium]
MLKIEHLDCSIDEKKILHDISVQFKPCNIHGIIGPNGSGKSTLLKNICRIWEPQSGTVFVNNKDYKSISRKDLSREITLVPQNTSIGFPVSVYDIVAMGRHPHLGRFQALTKKDREIIANALDITQTYELKDRNINELSGGECQLAILARALATEASLLLLDEPTSDLDIKHALTIMELLGDLKEKGKTILISIHDLNIANRYCDTISIINQGEIFFTGSPPEAFSKENIQEVFDVNMSEIRNDSRSFLYFYE